MKFPLHLVVEYAHTKPAETNRALEQLFGNGPLPKDLTPEDEELLEGLFGEWLIFDYRQTNGATFITEFLLRMADRLEALVLTQFTQIARTAYYGEFEIVSAKPGEYIELEDIGSGDRYRVFDKLGSQNSPARGTIRGRIAQVEGKYYLVGSNPIHLPLTFTKRMKRVIREEIYPPRPTLKETVELIRQPKPPPPPRLTPKDLAMRRRDLKKQYQSEAKKYGVTLNFDDIIAAIYSENLVNPGDFWKSLLKRGLSEKFFLNHLRILEELWNFFPHRCLSGKSPYEVYTKMKKSSKG